MQATEQAVIDAARDAMLAAAKAVGGSQLKAGVRWSGCPGGVGNQYMGGGVMKAPKGDTSLQLEAIRSAVVKAGFTDVTQVEGKVSVERDDINLTMGYRIFDHSWPISFRSKCYRYFKAEHQRVKASVYKDIEGLIP
ncbi:hypothetical protein EHF33_03705 [Deinococcus psychrotolerans]|uniref:Uncharacterized protein n=1 Tax=Deinococcus psychrotolerans TaxID=2489213 RepID=A0A3G8YCM8_9DEIO|nr:hypothetical protein [Deinococcus psychrotolerans]AZI41967.1 hypothetical protein EHF33_03705 [Deinococcus psychrotolerans]